MDFETLKYFIRLQNFSDRGMHIFRFKSLISLSSLHDSVRPTAAALAWDGVPIDRSSGKSFDVISIQFGDCGTVYPLRVFQPYENV